MLALGVAFLMTWEWSVPLGLGVCCIVWSWQFFVRLSFERHDMERCKAIFSDEEDLKEVERAGSIADDVRRDY